MATQKEGGYVETERRIQVSGMPEGRGIDREIIKSLIEKNYDKLAQRFAEPVLLEVHFKEGHVQRKKESQRAQVETNVKAIIGGGGSLLVAKQVEWSAEKAVKGAMLSIQKEAEKALRKK